MIPKEISDWLKSHHISESDTKEILNMLHLEKNIERDNTKKRVEFFLQKQKTLINISRETTADFLCISPRTFSRKLRKQKISFQELLNNERKRRCIYYLENNITSGAKIADLLGFSSPSRFYTSSSKWLGCNFFEFKIKILNKKEEAHKKRLEKNPTIN